MLAIDESVADRPDLQDVYFEVHDKIDAELHTAGLEHFGEAIAQRMELIEVLAARFNNDSRMIRRICLKVLDRIASILEPELQSTLDADSRRDMSIAAYLHDIGKSGPFDAPQSTQEAIVKLYAVENVADPHQTIAETARTNFSSDDAESILERLGSCGLRSNDTMRAFWDRHGYWTHDILEADSEDIPSRARVVAGSHHMDRGIDPYNFSSGDYVAMLENEFSWLLINTKLPLLEVRRLMAKQWHNQRNTLSKIRK